MVKQIASLETEVLAYRTVCPNNWTPAKLVDGGVDINGNYGNISRTSWVRAFNRRVESNIEANIKEGKTLDTLSKR